MNITEVKDDETYTLNTAELNTRQIRALSSPLALKILKILGKSPSYPSDIAKRLKDEKQKVYYHMKRLKGAGLIEVERKEYKQGAEAKYYRLVKPSFFVKFEELQKITRGTEGKTESFLEPFIADGKLDALIVVGSPDPHGPDKARSRDGYYGIDLALFLGTFLNSHPRQNVKLDTEVRTEDLANNLILIGGPIINKVTGMVNDSLPIHFDAENRWYITSKISKHVYVEDEVGMIVKASNPFNKNKKVLVVAGKRYSGTRAAIISFLKHFNSLKGHNIYDSNYDARVVEGIDLDADGIVDDVEFRE